MKQIFFLAPVVVCLLCIETTFAAFFLPAVYKPDLFLVFTTWAGLRLPFTLGFGTVFVGSVCVDVLSGSPPGLCPLIYCSICVACEYFNAVVEIDSLVGRFITTFCAAALGAGIVFFVRILSGSTEIGWSFLEWFFLKPFFTALSSFVLFPFMDGAHTAYARLIGIR